MSPTHQLWDLSVERRKAVEYGRATVLIRISLENASASRSRACRLAVRLQWANTSFFTSKSISGR